MPKIPKRIAANAPKIDIDKRYTLPEAAVGVKECATAKFDESVDLAIYLGVDPRHAEQMVRGSVSLPHGTGKDVRVVVICKSDQQIQDAKDAGAAEAGGAELADKIGDGWTDFDALVATPDMMGVVGKLGRVLGPRGLMPSPKAGSVTPDVTKAVSEIRKGKIDFRVDKNANIHVPIGKASFSPEQIEQNAGTVISSIMRSRPSAAKGTYMRACTISSTMGPGFRLDTNHLASDYSGKG